MNHTADKIKTKLEQVARLRALAAAATTQGEAEAAMAQAEAIIARYDLEEAEIGASGSDTGEAIGEADTSLWEGRRRIMWLSRLTSFLTAHYGCFGFERSHSIGGRQLSIKFCVVGRASDIATVRYALAWASTEITRLSMREPGHSRVAFCQGAVSGYAATLRRAKAATTAAYVATHGTGAAMVVASRADAAETWASTAVGKIGAARASGTKNQDAYARGKDAGSRIAEPNVAMSDGGGGMKALGAGKR